MTKTSRLKFIIGIIFALLLALGLTLYLQYSMSKAASIDAQLDSDTYTVGVGYSGIIEEQFVNVDDYIKKGDPLFSLRSPTLIEAIKNDEVNQSSLLYDIDAEGRIVITASVDGQIREVIYKAGAFVPANSEIAVVNTGNSLFVTAVYKLSGPDYGRISKDTEVSVKCQTTKLF
jgi:multidrug resistance efflux pump